MFATILFSLLFRCSLFEPRNTFEDPNDQNVVDMKWISGILECPKSIDNGVRFDSYLLTEMFTEDAFEYQDVNVRDGVKTKIFGKQQVIDRLNTIGSPKSVEWLNVGTCTNRGTDTIFVRDTKYEIVFDTTKITGTFDFDIVKQDKYRISKWINYPSGSTASHLTPISD
jgi:hypothetical protein